jgi:hypothetical protein
VAVNGNLPDVAMETLGDMEFEINAKDDLHDEHYHQPIGESIVNIGRVHSSFMHMSQEVSCH